MKLFLTATALSALALGNMAAANAAEHQKKHMHHGKEHIRASEVDDLRARMAEMQERLNVLEARPNLTEKEAVTDGNGLTLKIQGQVNKAYAQIDNGDNSHGQVVDNSNEFSVVDLTAEGKWNEDTTVGGTAQFKVAPNSSNATDVRNTNSGTKNVEVEKSEVFVANKRFGKLELGRGSMVSDTTMEATDHSGTTVTAIGASVNELAGRTQFVNKLAAPTATARKHSISGDGVTGTDAGQVTVASVFADVDGAGVQDRVSYTTPEYMGLTAGVGHAYRTNTTNRGNDMWDAALKYAADFFGHKFVAQVAYVHDNTVARTNDSNNVTGFDQVNGSAGFLMSNGFNIFVSGSHRDWDFKRARNAHSYQIKPGYQHKFFEAGLTHFALDWGRYNNFVFDASSVTRIKDRYQGQTWGAFIVQDFDRIASKVYVGWRRYEVKVKGNAAVKLKDIDAFTGGMSVKF